MVTKSKTEAELIEDIDQHIVLLDQRLESVLRDRKHAEQALKAVKNEQRAVELDKKFWTSFLKNLKKRQERDRGRH